METYSWLEEKRLIDRCDGVLGLMEKRIEQIVKRKGVDFVSEPNFPVTLNDWVVALREYNKGLDSRERFYAEKDLRYRILLGEVNRLREELNSLSRVEV